MELLKLGGRKSTEHISLQRIIYAINTQQSATSGVPCQVQPSGHGTVRPLLNPRDLCAASHSGVTTKKYGDSGGIHVHAGAEAVQCPSTYCPSICIGPALEYHDHGLTDPSAFADIEAPGYEAENMI